MISTRTHLGFHREDGAILPLIAILILVMLGFAAIGVDVSAAYAERRQAQSAADAGVMAGALMYLDPTNPSSSAVVDQVRSFASTNAPGTLPTTLDWQICVELDRPIDYSPLVDSGGVSNDCISLKQIAGEPALLRVRTPNWRMPTAFAGLIGFDTVTISAIATAEIAYSDAAAVLPTSLPAKPSLVECLGTPPSGQLPPADAAGPCNGPAKGNFGLLNSPWFGAESPHFTEDYLTSIGSDCDSAVNRWEDRAAHGLANGIDHLIVTWPSDAGPLNPVGTHEGPENGITGADNCASAAAGPIPYVLNPKTGSTDTLELGLIGNDASVLTAADAPGRLRQDSTSVAPEARLKFTVTGWPGGGFDLDNIGLWKYIDFSKIDTIPGVDTPSGNNECKSSNFSAPRSGRDLTDQMVLCLAEDIENLFIPDLINSPRFSLVPVLNYNAGDQFGNKWWAIREVRPVYLHSTWYDCDPNNFCLFHPDDLGPLLLNDDATYSYLFNPGESTDSPCYDKAGICTNPKNAKFQLQGISALVLEWGKLHVGAQNQLGGVTPFEVFLHDNE